MCSVLSPSCNVCQSLGDDLKPAQDWLVHTDLWILPLLKFIEMSLYSLLKQGSFTGPWGPTSPPLLLQSYFLRPWPEPDLRLVQCLFCANTRIEFGLFAGVINWWTLGCCCPFLSHFDFPYCFLSYLFSCWVLNALQMAFARAVDILSRKGSEGSLRGLET